MQHAFDIEIAQKYGVNVAIFLNNLAFWIKKNQANNKHFHDGRYWTYNTIEAYTQLFPYWTYKQMRVVLRNAIESGLILIGNYNQIGYDRTSWYALSDEGHELLGLPICPKGQMEMPKQTNPSAQKGTAIPDINTDIKPDIKSSCASDDARADEKTILFDRFWEAYPKKTGKKAAYKAWIKNKLYEKADFIISDIDKRKKTNWLGKDKQYIPDPASYLNGERWTDEIFDNTKGFKHGRPETHAQEISRVLTENIRQGLGTCRSSVPQERDITNERYEDFGEHPIRLFPSNVA